MSRRYLDTPKGVCFEYWVKTSDKAIQVQVIEQEVVFFVERKADIPPGAYRREPLALKTLSGEEVDALYFTSQRALRDFAQHLKDRGIPTYESDVKPEDRYLMERFVCGTVEVQGELTAHEGYWQCHQSKMTTADLVPRLSVVSIDIETEGLNGRLYSIGVYTPSEEVVFMVGEGDDDDLIRFQPDERSLLRAFLEWVEAYDPDVIIGWNVVAFDLSFLVKRVRELGVAFNLGRGGARCDVIQPTGPRQTHITRLPGRVVLDGIPLMRMGAWNLESYSLENVAQTLLGTGKLIQGGADKVEEINRQFWEDKQSLARYNLEDCRLVYEIFEKADLLNFAIERSCLTGLPLDRLGGSVAAFDFLYLPRLHREGYVAPDTGTITDPITSPGGYVMESKPGLYENVLVLDFKSLYPSIIRTFYIDPLGLHLSEGEQVAGFIGATFSREHTILPGLIKSLWSARDAAKRDKNQALSYAIKIIMNSFYGVLGSSGCRFYNPKLATSITKRGHELITRSKSYIESQGYEVIYGDTDSVFVLVGEEPENDCKEIGRELAEALNVWWREALEEELSLESHLEIEFETHYARFFMPTIRGSQKGSKKRYAGLILGDGDDYTVQFKGMESVRTDWIPLARQFQQELYRRIFLEEPYEDYVKSIAEGVLAGRYDQDLVYRKRLRQKIEDYTKNVPPHAQAAKKLGKNRRWVEYVITTNGPEPIELQKSPLDYAHYLDRQLAPAADALLACFGQSFEKITGKQMDMFE